MHTNCICMRESQADLDLYDVNKHKKWLFLSLSLRVHGCIHMGQLPLAAQCPPRGCTVDLPIVTFAQFLHSNLVPFRNLTTHVHSHCVV